MIAYLAKIFGDEKYADGFIQGNLFLNPLSFFMNFEEAETGNRRDSNEAIAAWFQPDQITIEINGHKINSEDLAAPVSVRMNRYKSLNVLCLFAGRLDDTPISDDEMTEEEFLAYLKRQLLLPEECHKLGEWTVLISNFTEFNNRILKSVQENNLASMNAGLVEYYDPKSFNGSFKGIDCVFKKHELYKHQSEYRIAIDTGVDEIKPLILNVGSLSDICYKFKTSEINDILQVGYKAN